MRASVWKMSVLILAVAVVVSGQTLAPNARVMPFNPEGGAVEVRSVVSDDPVTTTRDAQGIWFIEGGSLYDVYESMGYAIATDRLWQMDIYRRVARGKVAEILGAGAVQLDVPMRIMGYSDEELDQQFAALSADSQIAVQAYVDGVNRRIGEFYAGNWRAMPFEYWLLSIQSVLLNHIGIPVLPTQWETNDVLAWMALLGRLFDPEGDWVSQNLGQVENYLLFQTLAAVYPQEYLPMFGDLRWINDPAAQTYCPHEAVKSVMPDIKGAPALKGASARRTQGSGRKYARIAPRRSRD